MTPSKRRAELIELEAEFIRGVEAIECEDDCYVLPGGRHPFYTTLTEEGLTILSKDTMFSRVTITSRDVGVVGFSLKEGLEAFRARVDYLDNLSYVSRECALLEERLQGKGFEANAYPSRAKPEVTLTFTGESVLRVVDILDREDDR